MSPADWTGRTVSPGRGGALLDLADGGSATLLQSADVDIDASGAISSLNTGGHAERPAGLPPLEDGEVELWIPGLVNAHCHLELTSFDRVIAPTPSFPEWGGVLFQTRLTMVEEDNLRAAQEGVRRSMAAGVTAVGDITIGPWSAQALADSPMRAVLFVEAIAPAKFRVEAGMERFQAALAEADHIVAAAGAAERVRIAISPHAPHTVVDEMMRLLGEGEARRRQTSIHIAETTQELEYVREGTGEWYDFFQQVGLIEDDWKPRGRGPVACCDVGALLPTRSAPYRMASLRERVAGHGVECPPHTIVAHGNYLSEEEVALLAGRNAAVCWCPETHHFFYHSRWQEQMRQRLPVLLGTDSLASAWWLDPLRQLSKAIRKLEVWAREADGCDAQRSWPVADLLAGVTLRARDTLLGAAAGAPPAADFTILRWTQRPARALHDALADGAGELPASDELLRELFGPEADRLRRCVGSVIGGVFHPAATK